VTIRYELTEADVELAADIASGRRRLGASFCYAGRTILSPGECDALGATAEVAVARVFGVSDFDGSPCADHRDFDTMARAVPDVGRYQVKATRHRKGGLLLKDTDASKDGQCVILCVVSGTSVELVGWAYAEEVRVDKYWSEWLPRPAYLMPRSDLRPMSSLPSGSVSESVP